MIHPNLRIFYIIIKTKFLTIWKKCQGASVNLTRSHLSDVKKIWLWSRRIKCFVKDGAAVLNYLQNMEFKTVKFGVSDSQFVNCTSEKYAFWSFPTLGTKLNTSDFSSHEYFYWFWTLSKRKLSWGHKVSSVAATVQVIKTLSLTLTVPIQPCEV